jgi:Fic family protein
LQKKTPRTAPTEPIGLVRLIRDLGLKIALPATRSEAIAGARGSRMDGGLVGHLKFALRHEPVDLAVLHAVLTAVDRKLLENWVREEHTSVFARRAWYIYELLTGATLDIEDVPPTGYVDLLDPRRHVTGAPFRARRQRVNDNLLGNAAYCPLIRRTDALHRSMAAGLDKHAHALVEGCEPSVLARAVNYLYTKETKSSYAIEGESPSADRAERFVAALSAAADFDGLDDQSYVRLQNAIVDPRYAEADWRSVQNFVGQTRRDFTEHVHYVCPKPADVRPLMQGWMDALRRLYQSPLDAVCAAAAASFGFVFIHPFEDGNGRIHRFLIHHVLARRGFTPQGLLFPVSAVMLRDRRSYDRVLAAYSSLIMPLVQYTLDPQGRMEVHNATAHLYQYWDATSFAEYLYSCVEQAIHHDLEEEIGFLNVFDRSVRRTMEIVDMPDRRASLLVRLILQNRGTLAQNKREHFSEIHDEELASIETTVRELMGSVTAPADM